MGGGGREREPKSQESVPKYICDMESLNRMGYGVTK
jgi:hypothetical protein